MKKRLLIAALTSAFAMGSATAGDIFLTGHDVDLHSNQNGFDKVVFDYLRGSVATTSYRVGIVTGSVGSFTSFGAGYASRVARDITSFTSAADFRSFLSTVDVLAIASEESCGGCAFSAADVALLNGFRPEVTSFFNAGGDIFGLTGASNAAYYGFLPPSALASGAAISGSSGFTATAAGAAIGITSSMINGFQTHNRFTSYDPAFTVFENRGTEIISIGLKDGAISDTGVITVPGDTGTVPVPGTLLLLAAGVLGLSLSRRSKSVALIS